MYLFWQQGRKTYQVDSIDKQFFKEIKINSGKSEWKASVSSSKTNLCNPGALSFQKIH